MVAQLARLAARLSIRLRIYLAFVAVLTILAGLSVSAWLGLSAAARHFGSFSEAVSLGGRAGNLQLLVADLQQAVDAFVKNGTPSLKADVCNPPKSK